MVAARLDEANRQQDAVASMLDLLDQIRERVDDETWGLIVDFEWWSSREVVTGIEIRLDFGFQSQGYRRSSRPRDDGYVRLGLGMTLVVEASVMSHRPIQARHR